MTCPLADRCMAPTCRPAGRSWQAKSCARGDVEAFLADVRACMTHTRLPFGRACAKVFAEAMKGCERECLFA